MTKEEREKLGDKLNSRGVEFFRGTRNGKPDPVEALLWYKKAARLGNACAMLNIGSIFEGREDYEQAYHWYLEASLAGEESAMYNLGRLYDEGHYVDQDRKRAYPDFYKSVSSGEFMEILDSSYLVRGYYGPLWELFRTAKRKCRKCLANYSSYVNDV